MRETIRPAIHEHPVWAALLRYSIGPDDAVLPFRTRLARENGWSEAEAERVIGEYKRFCFLAIVAGHEVTPSYAVDQAWHLHLTYSRDYWEIFCPKALGRPLHHGPTAGGATEGNRYFEQYAQTLKSYERIFRESAPEDLWPNAGRRFAQDRKARRVHPRDGFFVAWGQVRLFIAAVALAAIIHVIFW